MNPPPTTLRIASLDTRSAPPHDASINAVVTLIWPYSSSTRSAALLLAESDYRLRRSKGQVRVQLSGPAAKAVATSRVGIGDRVTLGLEGAVWVDEAAAIRTPGTSVGELLLRRRLLLDIHHDSTQEATRLDVDSDDAESEHEVEELATPAPLPVRMDAPVAPSPVPEPVWSSPLFARSGSASASALFSPGYDPFAEDDGFVQGKGRKRSRFDRSSGDWRYLRDEVHAENLQTSDADDIQGQMHYRPEEGALSGSAAHRAVPFDTAQPIQQPVDQPVIDITPSTLITFNDEEVPAPRSPRLDPIQSPALPLVSPLAPIRRSSFPFQQLGQSVQTPVEASTMLQTKSALRDEQEASEAMDIHSPLLVKTASKNAESALRHVPDYGLDGATSRAEDVDDRDNHADTASITLLEPAIPTHMRELQDPLDSKDDTLVKEGKGRTGKEVGKSASDTTIPVIELDAEAIVNEGDDASAAKTSLQDIRAADAEASIVTSSALSGNVEEIVQESGPPHNHGSVEWGENQETKVPSLEEVPRASPGDQRLESQREEPKTSEVPPPIEQSVTVTIPSQQPRDIFEEFILSSPVEERNDSAPDLRSEQAPQSTSEEGLRGEPAHETAHATSAMVNNLQALPTPQASQQGSTLPPLTSLDLGKPERIAEQAMPLTPQKTQSDLGEMILVEKPPAQSASVESEVRRTSDRRRRKSLKLQTEEVPDIISPWFSLRRSSGRQSEPWAQKLHEETPAPRRSQRVEQAVATNVLNNASASGTSKDAHAVAPKPEKQDLTRGFRTALSYYAPLASLDTYLAASSSEGAVTIDVFGVVSSDSPKPIRSTKPGPRDYNITIHIVDPSRPPVVSRDHASEEAQVQCFRPVERALPTVDRGDIMLLRNFVVKTSNKKAPAQTTKGLPFLISSGASAWYCWRFSKESKAQEYRESSMMTRASTKHHIEKEAVSQECNGPPVEVGEEEQEHALKLRRWWLSVSKS